MNDEHSEPASLKSLAERVLARDRSVHAVSTPDEQVEQLAGRLDPVDCCASLAAHHAEMAADHEPGAVPWDFPDLKGRHDAAEGRLNVLANVPGGPIEADWRAGLAELRSVWLEARARYRAHRERQTEQPKADPMAELPASATVAVGFSYADEKPGTWERSR